LLIGLGNWLAEYSSNQNVVQRYAASRSAREARKAMWVCCCTSIPIWTFFMFLGTALYVFFLEFPHDSATDILYGHGDAKAEQILPFFVFKYLPIGLSGMVIAAVVAAAMSSLDSSINSVATVSVVDIYRRHLVKDRDDQHYLKVARTIAIAVSLIMIGLAIAYALAGGKTAQHVSTIMTALTAGGLLGLFLLGFLVPFGDGRAVVAGVIATLSFSGLMVAKELGFITWLTIDSYYTGIIGHVLMFVLGFVGCCIIGKSKRDLTNLTVWTQDKTPVH